MDISKPPHERVFKEIIPEQKANPEKDPQDRGATLEEVHAFANNKFAVKYKRNVGIQNTTLLDFVEESSFPRSLMRYTFMT